MIPAPFWRRLAAMAYDALLLTALWMFTVALLMLLSGGSLADTNRPFWLLLVERLLLVAVTWGFFAGFWAHGGQTLGMRAWRIRLVKADGGPVSLATGSLRILAACLSLAFVGLGYIWMLFDRDHLTWHDRLSGTRVLVVPKNT